MRRRLDAPAAFIARLFLGGVFAYAGYAKLMEPAENFQFFLRGYGVLPEAVIAPISYGLPWLEWIFGMFLIAGYAPRLSAVSLGIFSVCFAAVILMSGKLAGGEAESCGCFGEGGLKLDVRHIFVVDLINIFLGFRLFLLQEFPWSLDSVLKKAPANKV